MKNEGRDTATILGDCLSAVEQSSEDKTNSAQRCRQPSLLMKPLISRKLIIQDKGARSFASMDVVITLGGLDDD